jgi:hypothetical protein
LSLKMSVEAKVSKRDELAKPRMPKLEVQVELR